MKNKKKLSILFIIFYLLFFSNIFAEEFYFEASEIHTLDGGNIIEVPNGGKAIANNDIEIIADEFLYNKITTLLTANKNVVVIDALNKVTLKANKIFYLKNEEKIFTKGKTEINIDNSYLINSEDIFFFKNKMEIISNKKTVMNDNEKNFYTVSSFKYLITDKLFRGKKIKLFSKEKDEYFFEDGIIDLKTNEVLGKDLEVNFNNNKFGNINNEPRLKGNTASYNKNKTLISKGIFTTCKKRKDKCPPWTIKAEQVEHDKNKKIIKYKNAWLEVYDVPVMYFPKFFHPDPTVKRQSGFLTPSAGDSQVLGSSIYIPYFYAISNDKDLTFKPRLFFDNKISLQTEYRQVTKKTKNILDFSLTEGHDSNSSDKNNSRSHFFSHSKIDLDFLNYEYSNLEIQLQKTSNNTYLKLYDLQSPLITDASTLNSFLNFRSGKKDLEFDASIQVYEKLDNSNSDRYEFIFPNYNFSKIIDTNNNLKGNLKFDSAGSYNLYNTNVSEATIINNFIYNSENKYLDNGLINNFNILFKNVNTEGKNSSKYNEKTQSELLSSFLFHSSYPLIREGISFDSYFTPQFSLKYSPNSMKNLSTEDRRINIDNIFSFNRIASNDTVESGQSLTIGAGYKKTDKENSSDVLILDIATVFRDEFNENLPLTSSLQNKSSDLVGHVELIPNEFFKAKYNFSLDNNLNEFKYNEIQGDLIVNNFITSFKYVEENDNIGTEHYIQSDTSLTLNENSSITFSTRENKKRDLTEYYNLIYKYKNDCLTAALEYKKDFYVDGDIKPEEQLFFSITIVPLGGYQTKSLN